MSHGDVAAIAASFAAALSKGPSYDASNLGTLCAACFGPSCNLLRLQLHVKRDISIITGNLLAHAQPWSVSLFEDNKSIWQTVVAAPADDQSTDHPTSFLERRFEPSGESKVLFKCPIPRETRFDAKLEEPSSSKKQRREQEPAADIGALILGIPSTDAVDKQALKNLIALSYHLRRHYSTILDNFVSSVSSILLVPARPGYGSRGGSPQQDGSDWSEEDEDLDGEGMDRGNARSVLQLDPITLTFNSPLAEKSFSLWLAQHMWKFDAISFCLTLLFKTIMVFYPGACPQLPSSSSSSMSNSSASTSYALYYKLPWTHWMMGYVHGLPVLLLFRKHTRRWYQEHRDKVLLSVLIVALMYQQFIVANFIHLVPVTTLRHPLSTFNFLWLPAITLLYQMRFSMQAPTIAVTTSINLTLLRPMCDLCFPEENTDWCMVRAATKVIATVAAGLLVVYCIEWRARRVWQVSR